MAAPFALRGELGVVRLHDVPLDVRRDAAIRAARAWGLGAEDYLELMVAAEHPRDCALRVDVAKIERVLAGRGVPGPIPELPPQDPWRMR